MSIYPVTTKRAAAPFTVHMGNLLTNNLVDLTISAYFMWFKMQLKLINVDSKVINKDRPLMIGGEGTGHRKNWK